MNAPTQHEIDHQSERAGIVASELENCGHDISMLDLLDALASVGYDLVPTTGAASLAYLGRVAPQVEGS